MFITKKDAEKAMASVQKVKDFLKRLYDVDANGKYHLKPGITEAHLDYAQKSISKVASIYSDMNASLGALNREIDEHEKEVLETRNLLAKVNKKYGGNIYKKWLLKTYGVE